MKRFLFLLLAVVMLLPAILMAAAPYTLANGNSTYTQGAAKIFPLANGAGERIEWINTYTVVDTAQAGVQFDSSIINSEFIFPAFDVSKYTSWKMSCSVVGQTTTGVDSILMWADIKDTIALHLQGSYDCATYYAMNASMYSDTLIVYSVIPYIPPISVFTGGTEAARFLPTVPNCIRIWLTWHGTGDATANTMTLKMKFRFYGYF